jgi:hypothetical protein
VCVSERGTMFSILYAVQSAAATAELDGEKREEREGVFVRAGKSRNESKRSRNESESVASRALLRLLCRSRLRDRPARGWWCLVVLTLGVLSLRHGARVRDGAPSARMASRRAAAVSELFVHALVPTC